MKKTIIIGIIILLAVLGIMANQEKDTGMTHSTHEHKVAATIFPLYDMTKQIARDNFDVVLVLPSGTSPHTFDPQPSLLKDLQGSQAIFAIGHGLDNWATTIAGSINSKVITVDDNINLRATIDEHSDHAERKDDHEEDDHADDSHDGEHHDDHEDEHGDNHNDHKEGNHDEHEQDDHTGHDHGPIDPHYWLSLHHAEQIVMNIAHELSELDPENTQIYADRAQAYTKELEALEDELTHQTESLSNTNIIALHDAWYYFAKEFGLNIVGTFEPSAGKEPTPQYIINLKKEVQEHDVTTLFMEPQLSQNAIQAFANDHDLHIATIDPLGGVVGRASYVELMQYNVDQVVTALDR